MTPKERRERLFKADRPLIRPFNFIDESGYSKDLKILWVAHQRVPFPDIGEVTQDEFAHKVFELSNGTSLYVVDDHNDEYSEPGPIAFFTVKLDGWAVEPHVEYFPWATPRNILRSAVAFFQFIRYQKIGVCIVHSLKPTKNLFDHCQKYGVLHYVGVIVNGDQRGDDYIYSVRGKLNVGSIR